MRSELFENMLIRPGFVKLDGSNFEEAKQASGHLMLFCTGDPKQRPESLDLAIILPELYQSFSARFRVGVVDSDIEERMEQDYGVQQWPTLVLLRDGEYVGSIPRLRDWAEYLQEITALLQAPVKQGKVYKTFVINQSQGCA